MTHTFPSSEHGSTPFAIGDCALMTIATGVRAQNLREFREGLLKVPESSLHHHFWGRLLSPRFDEPEYSNDFASWAYRGLGEKALAERLSAVDFIEFEDTEAIRQRLVDVVEHTLDAKEHVPWARPDTAFHFLHGKLVVFQTGTQIPDPSELASALAHMGTGSIYYHFIDARRRTPDHCDDFCRWLDACGPEYEELKTKLQGLDPFFSSLKEIRRMLIETVAGHSAAPADSERPAPGPQTSTTRCAG